MFRIASRPAGFAASGLIALLLTTAAAAGQNRDLSDEAQAILERAPQQINIDEGEVLYIRKERFERHGPKATEIATVRDLQTEASVLETWFEVGEGRQIVRTASRITDADGAIVQLDTFQDGTFRSVNPQTNTVNSERAMEPAPIDSLTSGVELFGNWIAGGGWEVVEISGAQVTVEREAALPEPTWDWREEGSFELPFHLDLNAESMELRHTINGNDGTIHRSESYALTPGGEQVLVSSTSVTDFKVVGEIPPALRWSGTSETTPPEMSEIGLLAAVCWGTPTACHEDLFNTQGGVNLEARNSVILEWEYAMGGFYLYTGGALSWASAVINSIGISANGGHNCDFTDFPNTWFQSQSATSNLVSVGGSSPMIATDCFSRFWFWTNGFHGFLDTGIGVNWSPSTHAQYRCSPGLSCN